MEFQLCDRKLLKGSNFSDALAVSICIWSSNGVITIEIQWREVKRVW
jgi:hypothetical protein